MATSRRIRWPTVAALVLLGGLGIFLMLRPSVLAPGVTHLVNRQLQSSIGGKLHVGGYVVRPFDGIDAHDVTLTVEGDRGGLTMVAVDTLELDFRLREVLGLQVRVRRLEARGVEIYRVADEPAETDDPPFAPPRLHIDRAIIRDGRAESSDHHGQPGERISSFAWRGAVASDGERLQLESREGHVSWPNRGAVLEDIQGTVTVADREVRTDHLAATWNGHPLEVAGSLASDSADLWAAAAGVRSAEVADLTGLPLEFDAAGDIEIEVQVDPERTRLAADFTGRFEEWDLDGVVGEATIADGRVHFQRLEGGVGGSTFDGSLTVADAETITILGEVERLDLRRGLIPGTDAEDLPRTSGRGRLAIVHTVSDEVTRVRGLLVDGEVEIMPFDTCRVDVWARADSLHFREIDLRHGSVSARLVGSSDSQEVFRGDLTVAVQDLHDLPAAWDWPEVAGSAEGRVALEGPLDALGATGALTYQDLAIGPARAAEGQAGVQAAGVLGDDWSMRTTMTGAGFQLGVVPLGAYHIAMRADATSAAIDSFRTVRGDTVVTTAGRVDFADGRAAIAIDRGAIALEGNRWRLVDEAEATLGPGLVVVPHLHLASEHGEFRAEARYDEAADVIAGRLDVENVDLDLIDPFLEERFRPGGRATARVDVDGGRVEARGTVTGATFEVARLDSVGFAGSYRDGTVAIDTLTMVTDHGRAGLAGRVVNRGAPARRFWRGAELDLDVSIAGARLGFLRQFDLEAIERMDGEVTGRLHAGGTTDDPLVTGEFETAEFFFHWLRLDEVSGSIRIDPTQIALGRLVGRQDQLHLSGRIEIPLRFDLLSTPTSPPDGPFLAHLRVAPGSDLTPLVHATDAFTRVEGRGQGELIISGPMDDPRYQGRLEVHDAGFVLRGNQEVFRECEAVGEFRDDRLVLRRVSGKEGLRGRFHGRGDVLFDGLELQTWRIEFQADRFLVASIPELRAVVRTSNGEFTGVPVGPDNTLVPRFAGTYEVIKGRYTGDFSAAGAGAPDPTLGTVAPDWLADIRIVGPPRSARIVNATMELDLSGDVTLVRDADGMVFNGGMTIDNGRLPVFHNTFRVVRGRLDFSRSVGVVPMVDIDAETRVRVRSHVQGQSRVERITVHAAGPADAMTITYSSESGYPREAIERMLLGLSPYPDEQGDQSAIATASIGAGFNILEREIAREFELFDTIEIDQIQREQSAGVGLDPLIGVGKYLGTDLYIKYAQGLNQNDRDILIEYQINDLLLLQTEIRRRIDEYQGDATYNVDLKYRHEY